MKSLPKAGETPATPLALTTGVISRQPPFPHLSLVVLYRNFNSFSIQPTRNNHSSHRLRKLLRILLFKGNFVLCQLPLVTSAVTWF